jgi:hypothetical protein
MKKFKIVANKEQLDDIGISHDINGLEGNLIHKFKDGWLCIEVKHYDDGFEFINEFDIPPHLCEEVEN